MVNLVNDKLKQSVFDKETELIQRAKQGNEEALAELIKRNQGYIISFIGKQYGNLIKNDGFVLKDLIQEGNIGIIEALYKFDETKGFKFITYASYWIKLHIFDCIKNLYPFYNKSFDENSLELNDDNNELFNEYDEPAIENILIDENDIILNDNDESFDYYDDEPINGGDLLDDNYTFINEENDSRTEPQPKEIDDLLSPILDKREIKILKMYFGINIPQISLTEIGNILNLSSERVRQLKERALKRIKKRDKNFYDKYISHRID